ncbi:branched-chain amino acid ABC transporter permease [Microlunatus elymi]|uniref:Branched-chain amino acid ABC transporter permease n=1 Tax=Microlunatus elymi TaxID=2596828 RepID=A0A516Q3A0_9ACTN|nr:AzlC family ABC transporter permease [Microlunatus elymi]QDP97899.1 branched-chain amino acid ABC transporter permease [Microlunatus elymi]
MNPAESSTASVPATHREQVVAGIRDSFSAGPGIFPIGVALGLLVIQSGLPWWYAPASSIAVFAGSSELVLVGLVSAGQSLALIAATMLVINFRHVFYAFSFPVQIVRNRLARGYSVYAMIDEAYAVQVGLPDGKRSARRMISMQIASQSYWVGGALIGVLIGSALPAPIKGLEFALVALFAVLTLDAVRGRGTMPSLLLAAGSVAFSLIVAPQLAMLLSLVIFVLLLTVRFRVVRYAGRDRHA